MYHIPAKSMLPSVFLNRCLNSILQTYQKKEFHFDVSKILPALGPHDEIPESETKNDPIYHHYIPISRIVVKHHALILVIRDLVGMGAVGGATPTKF